MLHRRNTADRRILGGPHIDRNPILGTGGSDVDLVVRGLLTRLHLLVDHGADQNAIPVQCHQCSSRLQLTAPARPTRHLSPGPWASSAGICVSGARPELPDGRPAQAVVGKRLRVGGLDVVGREHPEGSSALSAQLAQSTATAKAAHTCRIRSSLKRPSLSTSTPIDTLSTESRFTAVNRGPGSTEDSRTTSLTRPRMVVVHGAIRARRCLGITASRESTTTGRRPTSGISHHHTSPRAGAALTMLPQPA